MQSNFKSNLHCCVRFRGVTSHSNDPMDLIMSYKNTFIYLCPYQLNIYNYPNLDHTFLKHKGNWETPSLFFQFAFFSVNLYYINFIDELYFPFHVCVQILQATKISFFYWHSRVS